MKLTHRGFKALILTITTFLLSFIFKDIYMSTIPFTIIATLLVEALMFRMDIARLRSELIVEPRNHNVKIIAGESYKVELYVKPFKALEFKTPKWITIKSIEKVNE
ncbi:MAG: hypothetical protein QW803_03890, partial [Candidatus Methanomethylicia archaeon]